jgi:hypothetical protein
VHEALLESAIQGKKLDLGQVGPALDQFASSISEVVVKGQVEEEKKSDAATTNSKSSGLGLGFGSQGPILDLKVGHESGRSESHETRVQVKGDQVHRVHFGSVGSCLKTITSALSPRRLWVLIDEWSVVPIDLQPLLADLIRRALLPAPNMTVKIGAIEQRTNLQIRREKGDYIGIEIGADVAADLNLDDFMVFENDANRATEFFRDLIFKHYKSVEEEAGIVDGPTTPQQFMQQAFTQKRLIRRTCHGCRRRSSRCDQCAWCKRPESGKRANINWECQICCKNLVPERQRGGSIRKPKIKVAIALDCR